MWQEAQRLPVGMLEQIVEYRRYAEAKADYDRDSTTRAHESPLRQLVRILEFEIVHEEVDARA